jgi:uncharacterized membrane protein
MNKFLKIIGIVLLVLAGLVIIAIPFVLLLGRHWMPFLGMGMRSGRMMGGFGMFGGLMMAVRILLPVLVVSALVLIGVAIGRGAGKNKQPVTQAAAAQPVSQPVIAQVDMGTPVEGSTPPVVESQKTCAHCGAALQDGWVNCPYCGLKI